MISQTTLTITIIIIISLLWALRPTQPAAAAAVVAIKRESSPISYMAALDKSLLIGDGRQVDWGQVTWPKGA